MRHISTTLVVASGKGGVGKSVIAVNLAETLAQCGRSVAIVDADLGQGACTTLLNIEPNGCALDLARHTVLEQEVFCKTEGGITLVIGAFEAGDIVGYEKQLYQTLDHLMTSLQRDHEFIIIDAPAGAGEAVRWAFDRADIGLMILVGEPTAIADAYRLTKMIWQHDPEYHMHTIVNFCDTLSEAESVMERFAVITKHFLGAEPARLGWIPYSPIIRKSVSEQELAVLKSSSIRDALDNIARSLIMERQYINYPNLNQAES